MTIDDVQSLSRLLQRMQNEDPQFQVFGSTHHRYRFGPPLSESELLEFERLHHITLPADYRFFLRNAGDGGAIRSSAPYVAINSGPGPGCGVLPLEEAVEECNPGRPFPLVKSVEVQPFPGIERWGDDEAYPGVLQLSYVGSAGYDFLVVNGLAYGTMWGANVDIRNFAPVAPSFEAWYYDWMKRLTDMVPSKESD